MISKRSNTASAKGRDIAPGVPAQKGCVMENASDNVRLADATGLSSASPIEPVPVSPVPASIPSAVAASFTVINLRDIIRAIPERFASQYAHYPQGKSFWNPERTMGEIIADLRALDVDKCSAEEVNDIIGNNTWGSLLCDVCKNEVERVLRIGEEPDYEARWQDVCAQCIGYAAQAIETRSAKTEGLGPQDESAVAKPCAQGPAA